MKKLLALALTALLLLSACGAAFAADEPITIDFWHTRGSGANNAVLKASVEKFNETVGKEKGITVVETYIGSYAEIVTKLQLTSQTGEQPAVAVCAGDYISTLLDDGLLADMAPYAAETGFDFNNFFDSLLKMPGNGDGKMHSVPYIKSTPVFYYNKTMADAKGLKAPVTVEDMEAFCKALHTVDASTGEVACWGFEVYNNISYVLGNWLWQLGGGFLEADGTAPCLNGSLQRVLGDWDRWINEGWCRPFDSTNATTVMQEMFFQGKMASFVVSCGSMANISKHAAEAGFELGVSSFPTYNTETPYAVIGGGELVLIKGENTEAQKKAGWEFIQFLMDDEQIAENAIKTGYLPTTKSIVDNPTMKAFWEANPNYKVAYDQLACAYSEAYPYFENRAEFRTNCQAVISTMVQERTINAEQAVEQIKTENAHLFN